MERRDIYQDTTGRAIDRHEAIEKISAGGKKYYSYADTTKDEIVNSNVHYSKKRIDKFLTESGNMANLAGYVALCKIKDQYFTKLVR